MIVTNLVIAAVRKRLSISKQAAQKFDMERFSLKTLNDVEVKEQAQNRFASLENLDYDGGGGGGGDGGDDNDNDDNMGNTWAWESIRIHTKDSAIESNRLL